ncbi:hypothetical protein OIDMADRAFT_183563 [Oidiodendron maius Zn]|uniref:DUF7709 domain-containing protein n=1 Tax=Oidiodendron maius (strain Zn) TaxID=913774 RepID=A0A0C3GJ27_OIDMZ|nr:hypothetical protein OIDMADRAFT_183563 [Oidiodendron maius Zn]
MSSLASVNNKIAGDGQSFPEIALADGTKVQTGTDATVEREELEKNLALEIPTFANVGFFGLFGRDEWFARSSKGRRYVDQKAKDMGI